MLKKIQAVLCAAASASLFAGTIFAVDNADSGLSVGEKFDALTDSATDIEFDSVRISTDDGRQHLHGNVVISVGGLDVRTEDVVYDVDAKTATLPGVVEVNFDLMRFIMRDAEFDGVAQSLSANGLRGGISLAFISGGNVVASGERFFIKDAVVYFCEPHWSSISFHADELEYTSKTDYMRVKNAVFRIAGVPVLVFPPFSAPRIERPPVRVWANTGSNSASGIYLRTMSHLTLWENVEPGILLDEYAESGILVGPATTYKFGDESDGRWAFGDLKTAYINDSANRDDDIYGNAIGGKRGFVEWTHKQEVDGLELSASMHYWSDSQTMRNFRPSIYDRNQNPDSYIEAVLPSDTYYISALTRFRLNDYQNVQQRLPEIRFDLQPSEILETGIFQHFNASYAFLREKDSDQYNLQQINHGNDELESSRADFYYGVTAPIKFGDVATFTPVLGARLTYYGETVPADEQSYTRTLGEIGFDMQFLATGTSNFQNKTWDINGLRHVLRPILRYRYIPGTSSQSSRIPEIDRETYLAGPSIMELSENRAVDQIFDEHVLRFGIENLFQTRDEQYGSRDLVEFNIYQDLRKTYRPHDDSTLSHNFIELEIKPAQWVNFFAHHRMDVYSFESRALTTGVRLSDGDLWTLQCSMTYVDDSNRAYYGYEPRVRQYSIGGTYKLNSYYSIFASWHFNDLTNTLTEQNYGFLQRLGNSWNIQYYVRYRQDAGDDSKFSVGISLNLVTF